MNEVTSNWIHLGDGFYDKVELYCSLFRNLADTARIVSAENGGLVLVMDRQTVSVFTCSGPQLASWKWNNPSMVSFGWSDEEEPLFVLEDGTVLIYSMFGNFKSSFSMGQEAKDVKILCARIFASNVGTGVAVLTTTCRFYMVTSVKEPRVRKLFDAGELPQASAWFPIILDRQSKLLVGKGTSLLLLSHNDMTVLDIQVDNSPGSQACIQQVAVSHCQTRLAVVTDSCLLWLGSLSRKLCHYQLDSEPIHLAWCGAEAVFLALRSGTALLVHVSGMAEIMYGLSPIAVTQECDGVRVLSRGFHDLIHRVEEPVEEIYKIGSMSPGSILLMASQAFQSKSHKADDYLRMIEARLDQAVAQCIAAAGFLFQAVHQKELMRAAKFGNSFLQGFASDRFYQQCQILKLLNCARHYRIGMPLTATQLANLSHRVLIDRLIGRRLFPLAIEICEYLKMSLAEGKNRVLGHWACYKVESSTLDEAETARQVSSRLGLTADISYSEVAGRAAECGKKRLAVQLLEHEVRADKQVPLLLKLGQGAQALNKAIDSGDTDLIYHVILTLQEQHSTADFHMIIRGVRLGAKLYHKYCSQYSQSALQSWLQQEDDWVALARHSLMESYATGRLESRLAAMVTAADYYKKASKAEFSLSCVEESARLLKYQASLEEKRGKVYVNNSLHGTISQLLEEGEIKLADKLRSEFKVTDRKYLWLKVRAFGKTRQWEELANLAKSKKSSIGFGPFVDVCIETGAPSEANRFLSLIPAEERLKYLVKLQMFSEAAELAFQLKNIEALTMIEVKCVNNFSVLELVASFKQRLQLAK